MTKIPPNSHGFEEYPAFLVFVKVSDAWHISFAVDDLGPDEYADIRTITAENGLDAVKIVSTGSGDVTQGILHQARATGPVPESP